MKRHLLIFLILLATRFAIANPGGGPTLANMVVTGTGIQWYTAATAGSLLPSSTALVNGTTYYASQTVNGVESATRLAVTATVNSRPIPTFTAQPGVTANTGADVTYTTQSGQSSYVWTFPGTLTTDYTITSGGDNTNSVTLKYVTTGSKMVSINYTANGCNAANATSSTATTVSTISGDAIYNALSTSQANYTSASANDLVKITSTEYDAVKTALSATAIGYTGAFTDWATTAAADNTTFSYNGNANDQTTSTFSALNYPVALSFHPAANPAAAYTCQLKYNNGGTVVNITGLYSGATSATIDRQYFVIKTPAQLPNATPYISLYSSKGIATVYGTGSHYWGWVSGNVTGSQTFEPAVGAETQLPSIQVLQTTTKQWP